MKTKFIILIIINILLCCIISCNNDISQKERYQTVLMIEKSNMFGKYIITTQNHTIILTNIQLIKVGDTIDLYNYVKNINKLEK